MADQRVENDHRGGWITYLERAADHNAASSAQFEGQRINSASLAVVSSERTIVQATKKNLLSSNDSRTTGSRSATLAAVPSIGSACERLFFKLTRFAAVGVGRESRFERSTASPLALRVAQLLAQNRWKME